ncbi:MAG: type II toxin-antitoxin system RelE/ParE family toxin [Methyloceanibacter sp.]
MSVAVAHEGSLHGDSVRRDQRNPRLHREDNPTAAKAVILRVEQVIARIARFPNIARVIDPSGVRVFPVAPFPYLLFYTVEAHKVIIRNVRHGRRRRPNEE